jgi:chromosomal replication initiation ATPase DnaA
MEKSKQLILSFAASDSYGAEDFLVDASNEKAYRMIFSQDQWGSHGLVLWGGSKVGKTHLAHLFQKKTGAVFLTEDHLERLEKGEDCTETDQVFILDSLEAVLPLYEKALFHLSNLLKEKEGSFLVLSQKCPGDWEIDLKDLESRLKAFLAIQIQNPSDQLLAAILMKKGGDLQIVLDPKVINYVLTHRERSPKSLQKFLEDLNQFSLIQGQKITVPLVKAFIDLQNS